MRLSKVCVLIGMLLIVSTCYLYAGFTASVSSGCAPLSVNFTTTASGTVTNHSWSFGNGNTSTQANPGANFINPGSYTVTLNATVNGVSQTYTTQITVYPNPVASFYITGGTNMGCLDLTTEFVDNSSSSGVPIVSWQWDYGDGVIESFAASSDPSHVYHTGGDFSVYLTVTDQNGCSGTNDPPVMVSASPGPNVSFSAIGGMNFCIIPATVQFSNNSSPGVSFEWSFGDGSTSTLFEPTHTYNTYDMFNVSLTVTDAQGCSNSHSIGSFIKVQILEADFEIPEYVCLNDTFQINNNSTNANQFSWEFNPGTSNAYEPELAYSQAGNHIIQVEASLNGDCTDSHMETIYVEYVNAAFNYFPSNVCQLPDSVDMINLSSTNSLIGGLSYEWIIDFTENSSSVENPVVWYTEVPELFFDYEHTFYDTLIVTSPMGCKDTVVNTMSIYLLEPSFYMAPTTGCVFDSITPVIYNTSEYNHPNDSVVTWEWDLGDGNFYTGFEPPPHTYTDTGTFAVSFVATTALGCEISSFFDMVQIGDKHHPDFEIMGSDTFCAYEGKHIINLSENDTFIDGYGWHFSDGVQYNYSTPGYHPKDTGWISFVLYASHNGCLSDTFASDQMYVLGPIGWLAEDYHDCYVPGPYYYEFSMHGIDYDHFYWDFGDGSPIDSVNTSVTHDFGHDTITAVTVTWTNDSTGCDYVRQIGINALQSKAIITADTLKVCVGSPIALRGDSSINETYYDHYGHTGQWVWNYGDSSEFVHPLLTDNWEVKLDTITTHTYYEKGFYTVQLAVMNTVGCFDTTSIVVEAVHPTPEFIVDPPGGCSPVECTFTDITSHPYAIQEWEWILGQGDTVDIQQPDTIIYPIGSYWVTLQLTDELGCTAITAFEVVSSQPEADFQISDLQVCKGDSIFFTNLSTTYGSSPIYEWDFGNGDFSYDFEPDYLYTDTGEFKLTLTVIDGGCEDEMTVPTGDVSIQDPNTKIVLNNDGNCAPVFASLTCLPNPSYMTTHFWSFGDGSPISTDYPAMHGYYDNGTVEITLFVSTSAGCTARDTIYLDVFDPSAELQISDHEICLGDSVEISIVNMENVGNMFLDLGDGIYMDEFTDYTFMHTYVAVPLNNQLSVSLVYEDETGQCHPPAAYDLISVFEARAIFDRGPLDADTAGCGELAVAFVDKTIGADSYFWNFNDGFTNSTQAAPDHIFTNPGEYFVELTITNNQYGCVVTEGKKVHVYPLPEIQTIGDVEICLEDEIKLWSMGGDSIAWWPNAYINDTTIFDPVVSPPASQLYFMQVKNEYDCMSDSSVFVYVQTEPELTVSDTTVIVGEELSIPIANYQHVEYFWEPPYAIDCQTCPNPVFSPLYDTTYYVTITAWAGEKVCYEITDSLKIEVDWQFSIDVPNIFTPNGDNINDVVYVDGWGVQELIEFSIFNRWGQKVFESHDIAVGWDGSYNGTVQPNDTYIYRARVLTFSNKVLELKGTINLIH